MVFVKACFPANTSMKSKQGVSPCGPSNQLSKRTLEEPVDFDKYFLWLQLHVQHILSKYQALAIAMSTQTEVDKINMIGNTIIQIIPTLGACTCCKLKTGAYAMAPAKRTANLAYLQSSSQQVAAGNHKCMVLNFFRAKTCTHTHIPAIKRGSLDQLGRTSFLPTISQASLRQGVTYGIYRRTDRSSWVVKKSCIYLAICF